MRNLKKLIKKKKKNHRWIYRAPWKNLHTMFKVMLKLPLKHSSPLVILCKNDGFSKCKQLGQSNHLYQVLQDPTTT